MYMIVAFCAIVTALCCYIVHTLLRERNETSTAIRKAMNEIDQVAFNRPIGVKKSKGSSNNPQRLQEIISMHDLSMKLHKPVMHIQQNNKEMVNITPKKKSFTEAFSSYPITPAGKLSTGFGFDVRV